VRVLYLHQYFVTRSGLTGTRSYEFARSLVRQGHQVTMICSGRHSVENWTIPAGRDFTELDIEGIQVVPIDAAFNNSIQGTAMSGVQRMREFLRFADLAVRVGKQFPRPDVVYATSTPLTIGLAGMKLGKQFGVPFVFEVRDVWPLALINCGALKNPLVIWWLRRMERKIYRAAAHIVALSPGMKEGVLQSGVVRDEDVTVITNGCDLDLFRPDLDGRSTRERLGLGDHFVVTYFGAMGLANGLEYVVEAARILQDRGDDHVRFVLHGDGGRRTHLESMVSQYGLRNVVFSRPVPDKAAVAELVAASNVCMTIYAATNKEQSWSPNKMFDALAGGRPVLINVPGWLGQLVEQNRCGHFVDPARPEVLAETIRKLAHAPAIREEMGRNARILAEREFARKILVNKLEKVLADIVKQP